MEWRHRSILGGALMAVHPRRWSETAGWRTRQAELRHSKAAGAFGGAAGGLALSPIRAAFLGGSRRVVKPTMKAMKNLHRRTVRQGKHSAIALGLKRFNEFHLWFQSMAAKQKRRPRPLGSRGRVFNCARNGRYPYGGRKTAAVPDAS